MSQRVDALLAPYYCKMALMLCQKARINLNNRTDSGAASELCSFISTLCVRNGCEQCTMESNLCARAAEYCLSADKAKQALRVCDEARKLCPKSFTIQGS